MKFVKPRVFNAGDKKPISAEKIEDNIGFNIYKNNNRLKPEDPRKILIISCFSEFGCEIVGCMYCLPRIMQKFPGHYKIAVGWYGREYLYRHLVDEFWEIKKEHQWLRDYCRAFHHVSNNLKNVEKSLQEQGHVIASASVGRISVGNTCKDCNFFWGDIEKVKECKRCKSTDITRSLFGDVSYWKPQAIKIPKPSSDKLLEIENKYLSNIKNPVGVFARNRKTYGRNLQPEFYIKLIQLLRQMGYSPIWLGEEENTLKCPVDDVVDFSRMKESRDLEITLSIISKCKFTFQAYTASTRLASMVEVPYLLFESPEQIWGRGQEGFRRNLCDFGNRKLVVSHFLNMYENNDEAIRVVKESIEEMESGNYEDKFAMLNSNHAAQSMKLKNKARIGES